MNICYKLWPHLKHLPIDVVMAAITIDHLLHDGGPNSWDSTLTYREIDNHLKHFGFKHIGSGAQTVAYGNGAYVIKGFDSEHNEKSYFQMILNSKNKKLFKLVQKFVVPTLVFPNGVAVQEMVKTVAAKDNDLDGSSLCEYVEIELAPLLGIDDAHEWNWGLDVSDQIKIFDIGFTFLPSFDTSRAADSQRPLNILMETKNYIQSLGA